MNNNIMRNGPVVCAVEDNYIILIPVKKKALAEIRIGEYRFFNHSNGIRKSDTKVQKFVIPMKILDKYREYTVILKEVFERLPYECKKGESQEYHFNFYPVSEKSTYNVYYISDCHGLKKESIGATGYFGDAIDLLILNGDISSSCSTVNEIMLSYDIAFAATKGEKPCIITRGNHDLRGKLSEQLTEYMPTANGRTYYYVNLGNLYFLVLDCGEDKDDSHKEYSETAAFHPFRLEETAFINSLPENISSAKNRIVLSHIPFCYRDNGICRGEQPFNIEEETYNEWTSLINSKFAPTLTIAGHLHTTGLFDKNSKYNSRGIDSPLLISGKPIKGEPDDIIGSAIIFGTENTEILFTDSKKNIIDRNIIELS